MSAGLYQSNIRLLRSCAIATVTTLCLWNDRARCDEPGVRRLFQAYCADCHGAENQEGGLRLDSLSADFAAPATFASWVTIHDRLQVGEMPPKDSAQPSTSERQAVVKWLGEQLTEADLKRRRAAGRSSVRRLNRTEYENTLRDLLDLPSGSSTISSTNGSI